MSQWINQVNKSIIGIGLSLTFVMVLFLNCEGYYGDSESYLPLSCVQFDTSSCVRASESHIDLQINSPLELPIQPYQSHVQISGDCNEGSFSQNSIQWDLSVHGQTIASGESPNSCVQGSFVFVVSLPLSSDGESLLYDQQRVQHLITVELVAQNERREEKKNPSLGKKIVYLNPIQLEE